jgi:hypothetical protein
MCETLKNKEKLIWLRKYIENNENFDMNEKKNFLFSIDFTLEKNIWSNNEKSWFNFF